MATLQDDGALLIPDAALKHESADSLTIGEYREAVALAGQNIVSIILPVHNQRAVLGDCFERIKKAMDVAGYAYEIIVVDDASTDGTAAFVEGTATEYPVQLIRNEKSRGRSAMVKQGLDLSAGELIVLFDVDMLYSPQLLAEMIRELGQADIVIANRKHYQTALWYAVLSRLYRWFFGSVMLFVSTDLRSGLKVFKRSLLEPLRFAKDYDARVSFDIFLLYHARRAGWVVKSLDVSFDRRTHDLGPAFFASRAGVGWAIVRLRISHLSTMLFPFLYPPAPAEYFSAGFTNVNDYLFLTPTQSAKGHVTKETVSFVLVLIFVFTTVLFASSYALRLPVIVVGAATISLTYIGLMSFKLWMMIVAMRNRQVPSTQEELDAMSVDDCPVISMLIPLYKEGEIIPQIFRYLLEFDYPEEKLDIIFIFESTDTETADAFLAMNPPPRFKALLSPDVQPKTKPKAMNVAFKEAKGDIIVIYDAEVLPEKDQPKKAALMLKKHPEAMYLHSKMDVYNETANWLTRLYTGEFSYFYDFFLPGLVKCGYPLPISGHSTYFRREVIERVGAWDAYNVAEDCDIGIRIFRKGFGSGMILESYTWEQSTTTISTWVRQRTRWIQGFIQTSIVQLRYPLLLKRELKGWKNFIVFLILVPGNVSLNIMNIFQWAMFGLWHFTHAPFLQDAYVGWTLYLATICFLAGNFLFTFFGMYALYERKHYSTVPWSLLMVVYWIMLGVATIRSSLHLFLHPHKWDKTTHTLAKQNPHA